MSHVAALFSWTAFFGPCAGNRCRIYAGMV